MENTYKEGQTVFAKVRPDKELTIRRYVDRVYYCRIKSDPLSKDLVYFERELVPESSN